MRTAYALIGLAWLIIIVAGAYAFNHHFIKPVDTDQGASLTSSTSTTMAPSPLTLTSSAFENGASIPAQFTCDGDQINPPLSISGVPAEAKSLALIVHDPDIPKKLKPDGNFDHWVLFNIDPATREIPQGDSAGISGANGAGKNQYAAPCPPPQYEPSEHRYVFMLYALDQMLSLQTGASKDDLLKTMENHIIAETQLLGRYKRK